MIIHLDNDALVEAVTDHVEGQLVGTGLHVLTVDIVRSRDASGGPRAVVTVVKEDEPEEGNDGVEA